MSKNVTTIITPNNKPTNLWVPMMEQLFDVIESNASEPSVFMFWFWNFFTRHFVRLLFPSVLERIGKGAWVGTVEESDQFLGRGFFFCYLF
jgi:hypothetical protein